MSMLKKSVSILGLPFKGSEMTKLSFHYPQVQKGENTQALGIIYLFNVPC